MSGEQLTCVWQAVYVKGLFKGSGEIPKEALQEITSLINQIPHLEYSESSFNDTFSSETINFQDYKDYVNKVLRKKGVPLLILYDAIENACWDICKPHYDTKLNENETKKLWMISNRLVNDSYPPVVSSEDANWFVNQIFEKLQKKWKMTLFANDTSFSDALTLIENFVFQDSKPEEVATCINELYQWLVNEESKRGVVKTRTKLFANWTPWATKSCSLTSKTVTFFSLNMDGDKAQKKDCFCISKKTRVEKLSDLTEATGRLRLFNGPTEQCEIAIGNETKATSWMAAINEAIECCKVNTTPVQRLIKELHKVHNNLRCIQDSLNNWQARLVDAVLKSEDEHGSVEANGDTSPSINGKTPPSVNGNSKQTAKSPVKANKDKLKAVFMKIDTSGDGRIQKDEFGVFIENMGLKMSDKELNLVFNSVDKDNNGTLSYNEFENYLLNQVVDQTSDSDSVNAMRMAFMEADRNGSGTINFNEFSEYIWERKRSDKMTKLLQAFSKMQKDKEGEIDFDQFQRMLSESGAAIDNYEDDTLIDDFEENLKNVYKDTDTDEVAKLINERWKSFNNFDRKGKSGTSVMTTDDTMVADFVPGEYSLVDLACFTDLPPLVPKHVVIKNANWVKSDIPGKSGNLILPAEFDGNVPVDIATNELLRYYGCSFADSNSQKVCLLQRHGIQDFTYENNYLEDYVKKKGAGIETHEFSHIDCPLSNDSGIFVLGRLTEENDLHLTGFKIPTRHVLYVPKGCIHSNDYLVGTWRTMLSDSAPINHVNLKKVSGEKLAPMTLNFVQ